MPASQHRLFVAVDPPTHVATRLDALRTGDLDARWVNAGNHHLTVKFIGNVDTRLRDEIARTLEAIDCDAPPIQLSRLTVFPSWRRPSVLVVLADQNAALTRLFQDVEKVLQAEGIPADARPFTPHVTLARFKRVQPEEVRVFVRERHLPQIEPFHPHEFVLYESALRPTGAAYTRIAAYPFAAIN